MAKLRAKLQAELRCHVVILASAAAYRIRPFYCISRALRLYSQANVEFSLTSAVIVL